MSSGRSSSVVARTALYLGANIVQRLANLLLIPLLMVTLTPADYSRYGLFTSVLLLSLPLFTWNLHLAPGRLVFDRGTRSGRAKVLLTSAVSGVVGASAGALLIASVPLLGLRDPVSLGSRAIGMAVGVVVVARTISSFGATVMRIYGRAAGYVVLVAIQSLGLLLFFLGAKSLLPDPFLRLVASYLLAELAAALVAALYSVPHLRGGEYSAAELGRAWSFAWPTAFHLLAIWAITSSGRWIGAAAMPLEELAAYTLITQIVAVVSMFGRAIFDARLPDIGEAFSAGALGEGTRIIRQCTVFALALVIAAFGVGFLLLFSPLPLPEGYRPSGGIFLLAMTANIFDAWYLHGIQVLRGLKQTLVQLQGTLLSGAVTVVASLLLVRAWRDEGLMVAIAVGYLLQAVSSNWLARRELRRHGGAGPLQG